MLNCPKCNSFVKEGQKFCTKCGANVVELLKPKIPPELAASVDIQEKKIAQDPLNPKLYIKLGDTYRDNKFYEEALIQYQKAISIDETNAEAHLKSGEVYFSLRRLDRTKDSYEKVLKLQPESFEVKINLFSLLKELNLASKAIELGKEIIKTEPKNLMVHKGLKEILLRQGFEKEAIEELKTIIALEPLEKEAYKQLGEIYEKRKENDKAFENYKMVLGLGAEDKNALFFVSHFLYEKGIYDEAIKYFEELILLDPANIMTRSYLTLSYLKKENLEKAARTVDAIDSSVYWKLSNNEKKLLSEIYLLLGIKFHQISDLEKAKINLQTSLKLWRYENAEKELARIYAIDGDAAFTNERYSTAYELYEKAIELDKEYLEYQEKLTKIKKIVASKRKKTTVAILAPLAVVAILVIAFFVWRHFTTGLFSINYSNQEVVDIEIDGNEYKTGFIRIKKGEHNILVKGAPGYADTSLVCNIPGGKKTLLELSLIPLYGSLKVNSNPSGAEVWLDNELLGNTPLTLREILAITHRLTIKSGGYKRWDTVIAVNPNKVVNLGAVRLKNLVGLWRGDLPRAEFPSSPLSITLNIKQRRDSLFIKYLHRDEKDTYSSYFEGSLKGIVTANKIFAEGNLLYTYWSTWGSGRWVRYPEYDKRVTIEGTISEDWNRIEGVLKGFGGGEWRWWVERQKGEEEKTQKDKHKIETSELSPNNLRNIKQEEKIIINNELAVDKDKKSKAVDDTKAKPTILYQSHVQDYGWLEWKRDGAVSGTTGKSRRMEAIKIKIENLQGSVKYRVNAADIGWMDWVKDGQVSGTTGQSRRLEAIQIELTGCPGWTIQYRVHVQDIGWMDWVREGQTAGTTGQSKRLEAIQIKLISR